VMDMFKRAQNGKGQFEGCPPFHPLAAK